MKDPLCGEDPGRRAMVYVISDGSGYVKIGVAENVNDRLLQLQTGNPRELKVLYSFSTRGARKRIDDWDLEHLLHKYYDSMRVITSKKITEWFDEKCCETIEGTVKHFLKSGKNTILENGQTITEYQPVRQNEETIGKLKGEIKQKNKYIQRLRSECENKRKREKELLETIEALKKIKKII